jgi:hypothetical protein
VNRYYDPQRGRFNQVDPLGIGASSLADPQSLNLYAYVGNDAVNRTDPDGRYPRDQHMFITFLMAALQGRPNAAEIGFWAGEADSFRYATTGLFGAGYVINFPRHFGRPPLSLSGLSAREEGFVAHLMEDNGPGGPHQIIPGYSLGVSILNSLMHIGLNLIGKSPDKAGKMGGWITYWDAANASNPGPDKAFPADLISHIVDTVNANNLTIIGAIFIPAIGPDISLGSVDLTGATLVSFEVKDGVTVSIWKTPSGGNFYDDPNVQAIQRQFSYPGSDPLAEALALYEYQLQLAGFRPGIGGGGGGPIFDWFRPPRPHKRPL